MSAAIRTIATSPPSASPRRLAKVTQPLPRRFAIPRSGVSMSKRSCIGARSTPGPSDLNLKPCVARAWAEAPAPYHPEHACTWRDHALSLPGAPGWRRLLLVLRPLPGDHLAVGLLQGRPRRRSGRERPVCAGGRQRARVLRLDPAARAG